MASSFYRRGESLAVLIYRYQCVSLGCAGGNGEFEGLGGARDLFAAAPPADALENLALSLAGPADGLKLLDEAGSEHLLDELHALSTAVGAFLDVVGVLGADAVACAANALSVQFQLHTG